MTFSKKQKARNPREADLVPMGRAHSEAEPEDNTPSRAKRRLQDLIDEDLLQESNGAKSGSQDLNPYIQQRSQSMFIQTDSHPDDLLDFNSAHLQQKKTGRRKDSQARKRKSQFGEAKHLASKVQSRINAENRKSVFPETTKEQEERIRRNSPYGHLLTWKLFRVIVKANDDIRQEQFAI